MIFLIFPFVLSETHLLTFFAEESLSIYASYCLHAPMSVLCHIWDFAEGDENLIFYQWVLTQGIIKVIHFLFL